MKNRIPTRVVLLLGVVALMLTACALPAPSLVAFNPDLIQQADAAERLPVTLSDARMSDRVAYWELRTQRGESLSILSGGPSALSDLPADLQREVADAFSDEGINGLPLPMAPETLRYFVLVVDGEVYTISGADFVREMLEEIDTPADAQMLLIARGYLGMPEYIGESATGYQFLAQRDTISGITCWPEAEQWFMRDLVSVTPRGRVIEQARESQFLGCPDGSDSSTGAREESPAPQATPDEQGPAQETP